MRLWREGEVSREFGAVLCRLRASPAADGKSRVDFGRSTEGVPGEGSDTNNLNELSSSLGCFQGNRRKVIQQNIIAKDQISAARGSYFFPSYTSGAKYGSDPTIPMI